MPETVRVMAAIIEKNGKILICQRKQKDGSPGQWEFPGGKIEPRETEQQCVAREVEEELGLTVTVGSCMERTSHCYESMTVELGFYQAEISHGTAECRVHAQIAWVAPEQLTQYDFLPADLDFIRKLAKQKQEKELQ
jgi:mutator protein MutT